MTAFPAVTVRKACLRDATYVMANMRPADHDEIMCQVPADMHIRDVGYFLLMSGDTFIAYDAEDRPVMFFGTQPQNVVSLLAWAVGTHRVPRVLHGMTRWLIAEHLPARMKEGFVGMEARSAVGHRQSHAWLRSTGAVVSGEPFVYGRNGEKFLLFRWELGAFAAAAKRYEVEL